MKVRASSLDKLKTCHGYAKIASQHDSSNKYTLCGTLVHLWLEAWINDNEHVANKNWPSYVRTVTNDGRLELAQPAQELLLIAQQFAAWYPKPEGHHHTEIELTRKKKGIELVGHADLVIIDHEKKHCKVVDWKLYRDPSYLPPIEDNLQLKAYAVMTANRYKCKTAEYEIALVRQCDTQNHTLDADGLRAVGEEIDTLLEKCAKNRYTLNFGTHCGNCLMGPHCPEFQKMSYALAHDLYPYKGGPIHSGQEAANIAKSLPAAEKMCKAARASLKEWLKDNEVHDDESNKSYRAFEIKRTGVLDPDRALSRLVAKVGSRAYSAASLSIKSITNALDEANISPEARMLFLEGLKDDGVIGSYSIKTHGWRKNEKV